MSDINGTGYGSGHDWKCLHTEPCRVTFYQCRACEASFGHAYDDIPDIFLVMKMAGVREHCLRDSDLIKRLRQEPDLEEWESGLSAETMRAWNDTRLEAANALEKAQELQRVTELGLKVIEGAHLETEEDLEKAQAELKKANAREKAAFMAGFKMDSDCRMGEPHTKPNPEQKWLEYRCQDGTD